MILAYTCLALATYTFTRAALDRYTSSVLARSRGFRAADEFVPRNYSTRFSSRRLTV